METESQNQLWIDQEERKIDGNHEKRAVKSWKNKRQCFKWFKDMVGAKIENNRGA